MAITINHLTYVISVPKADMTLIQSTPVEIRQLDINWFRLQLKDLEDDFEGMTLPTTHNHYPPVTVGGVTLARVIEMLDPYSVTFEDGQYAVNLSGANSNIGDRVNVNQVSVRSANSAGLVQTAEIEYASFQGGVWVDATATTQGTVYPAGTARQPVNNLADAMLIANYRGLTTIYAIGDLVIDSGGDYQQMTFIGESKSKSLLTISSAANVYKCEFYDAHVTGILDGECVLKDCLVDNLNYVSGFIESCVLAPGTILLGGATTAHFLDCYSGVPGVGTPTIDMGGDGPSLAMRNYNGGIALTNKTGVAAVSIDLNSGQILLAPTVTNGDIVLRGMGKLTDNSNGATVIAENLLDLPKMIDAVWAKPADQMPVGGVGEWLYKKALTIPKFLGLK